MNDPLEAKPVSELSAYQEYVKQVEFLTLQLHTWLQAYAALEGRADAAGQQAFEPGWESHAIGYDEYGISKGGENPDIVLAWNKGNDRLELIAFPDDGHDVIVPLNKAMLCTLRTNIDKVLKRMEADGNADVG